MAHDISLWNRIMRTALALPGVAVDRENYLRSVLKEETRNEDSLQQAIDTRPATVASRLVIDKLASRAITYHTGAVTTLSTVTGLPGGPAIVASIPADLAQYYYHVFVLAQKLAYLYGFPDMRDEKARLSNDAMDMLTLFVGVMMGAKLANDVIRDISRDLAIQVAKKLPQQTLTRTVYYPVIKQVAKRIGVDLSKSSFTKTFGKFIPLLGGIVSGTVTYATFYPGAKRLQKALHRQMDLLGADVDSVPEYPMGEKLPDDYMERLAMRALVNMALMDDGAQRRKREYLAAQIEHTSLEEEEKRSLLEAFDSQQTYKVEFDEFCNDPINSTQLMRRLAEVIRLQEQIPVTAKIYLNKISRELGYSPKDVEEFIKAG